MGAERDDAAAAKPRRSGTEPGLGGIPAGSGHSPAAEPLGDDDQPEAVDFDALHAALGDPLALDELPHEHEYPDEEESDHGHEHEEDDELPGEEGDGDFGDGEVDVEPLIGESQGRSSAHYASARPHTIPPSHVSTEDINAPPVIVASEDIGATVPSGPPVQMTKPINQTRPIALTPLSGVPFVQQPAPQPGSASGSGPHPAAAVAPYSEQAVFEPAPYPRGASQMTVRMPDRPVAQGVNPRRGKIQTLVVRPRGPSTKQKLFAFMAMLLLVTACGIAVIIWRKPAWVGLEAAPTATTTSLPAAPVTSPAPSPSAGAEGTPTSAPTTATATTAAVPSASGAPSASMSAKPKPPKAPASAPAATPH